MKSKRKGLGVFNSSLWKILFKGAIAFLISLKGLWKKHLGNPDLSNENFLQYLN